MEIVANDAMQRKEALNSLMGSAGMKILLEAIGDVQAGVDSQLESAMHEAIDQSKLAKLNFQLGKKKAYTIVLEILDSFKEELEERENSPSQA